MIRAYMEQLNNKKEKVTPTKNNVNKIGASPKKEKKWYIVVITLNNI